jgi:hypothetical protein
MSTPVTPFGDDEFRELVRLLHEFCSRELDQFAHWRLATDYGDVFVSILRELPPDWPPEAFDRLDVT